MKKGQIFVGGLPSCSSKRTVVILTNYFSTFGNVEDVYPPDNRKGFAFVRFEDPNTALKVCEKNKHEIHGRWVRLA